MFKTTLRMFSLLALAFTLCGCELINEAMDPDNAINTDDPTGDSYEARFVLGIFSIVEYPRASRLERELKTATGESIWINRNQYFGSQHIKEARVVARPGNPDVCDLKLRMDRAGKTQWDILAGNYRGQQVVLVVDGRHMTNFIPGEPDENNRNWVTVRVGIDHYTARGIAKFAKKNYAHYNPDSSSFFSKL